MANNSAFLYLQYESFAIVRNILQKELEMTTKDFCAFFQTVCFVILLLAIKITV